MNIFIGSPLAAASLGIAAAFPRQRAHAADDAVGRKRRSRVQRAVARDKAKAENPDGADRVYGGKEADKGAYPFSGC